MSNDIGEKLQEIFQRCQTWVDNEKYIPRKFRTVSGGEEFAGKITGALENEMIKQKFGFRNGKIYLPTKYTVEISWQDFVEFTGIKREVLIAELNKFVEKHFRITGAEFSDRNFVKVVSSAQLKTGEINIRHHWEESYDPKIVFAGKNDFSETARLDDFYVRTNAFKIVENTGNDEQETIVKNGLKKYFSLDIGQDGKTRKIPVFQPAISIGRGSSENDVDIILKNDLRISRHHAVLSLQSDNTFTLTVTGQNPVMTDAECVSRGNSVKLKIGDEFQIGWYRLKLAL